VPCHYTKEPWLMQSSIPCKSGVIMVIIGMRSLMFTQYLNTPVGWLKVYGDARGIMEIAFVNEPDLANDRTHKCLNQAITQLEEYFAGKRTKFDLPLTFQGTAFQYDVYNALLTIPFGTTTTYQELAGKVGNTKASQAVGNALHQNKFAIVVPCHRIVGQHKKVTNYLGGASAHHYLIDFEASAR
jgi:methylated-DNA-[protein]-cysteine S-methyltransferase